jgi:hypothetical protein
MQLKLMLDLYDELEAANPDVNTLVEAMENEMEYVYEGFAKDFDELFLDNGIAVNTYNDITEYTDDVNNLIALWQNDMLKKAWLRLCTNTVKRNK